MVEGGRIGKYEILREIGRGAMGVVYEGYDPLIKRAVTLQTIRADQLTGENAETVIARLRREAQAAGRLNHPNIVAIYDFGEDAGVWYIAMEFVDGRELKDYFQANERFATAEIVQIMTQILAALGYSHTLGVIHRDINPANVFILKSGDVKVSDFGIADIESSNMTQVGTVLDTPSYMSPEQIRRLPIDGRSDLFSVGVILYQFLTGERPFNGSSTTTMHKVLEEDPLPPSRFNVQIPGAMDAVVRKALAKRPEDRYQTAADFAYALRDASENEPSLKQAMNVGEATVISDPPPPASAAPYFPRDENTRQRARTEPDRELVTRIEAFFSLKKPWLNRMVESSRRHFKRLAANLPIVFKRTVAEAEPVLIGVTAPKRSEPGRQFSAVLVVYVEATRAFAHRTLHSFAQGEYRIVTDVPPDRNARWLVGTPVTVQVTGEFVDVTPAEARFEWNGSANLAAFSCRVKNERLSTSVTICFHVSIANVPIAFIPLQLEIGSATTQSDLNKIISRSPNSAFASYASKDAEFVAYSLSTLARWVPALDIFQDCLDLTPNEAFKPQLSKQIASRDVFLLYWSRHAAASPWVKWEYDTARDKKGMNAILPIPLEDPAIAPPPVEYLDVHMRDRFLIARYGLAKIKELAENASKHPRP